jgi:hypothetical protein
MKNQKENPQQVQSHVFINPNEASVSIVLYCELILPGKLSNIIFFDMELNRPIRLFTKKDIDNHKLPGNIFVSGQNILSANFSNPDIKQQIIA